MVANPNPQSVAFAAWEAPTLTITMSANGSIAGQVFQLNIRDEEGNVVLQVTPATITGNGSSTTPGVFTFTLTSAQTGAMTVGDYRYDVWRTDSGSEKRLCYGVMSVEVEQW